MKDWTFQVPKSPQEVIQKLNATFEKDSGFNYKMDSESGLFSIRKPVRYPDQILHRNRMLVHGVVVKANSDDETEVQLSFAQDFYMNVTVFSVIIFGLILISLIVKFTDGALTFALGTLVVLISNLFWIALRKKQDRDTEKYKTLLSDVLRDE